jgi:hypothetical protein
MATTPDFDAMLDAAPALLAQARTDMHVLAAQGYAGARPRPSVLFLVGYSAKRTSFKAVHLASDNSFEPVEIEGLIDCCASHLRDQPCPCGFGERFADCCSIDAGTHATAPREAVTTP